MDFRVDLHDAIVSEFTRQGISFPEGADVSDLVARHLEMLIRRIEPVPRHVHLSEKIHCSLGGLVQDTNPKYREQAQEAWGTVFYLRYLFERGESVLPHLSRGVNNTDTRRPDGLLWDYAMHHLHLSRAVCPDGFVQRSHWLLYVIVAAQDVYFVDVRPHKDREGFQWVRQDLLTIVQQNWPELLESSSLRGITGDTFSDPQKFELRRKNVNAVHEIGGLAVAPLGFGTMGDGHSSLCRFLGDKLLYELEDYQRMLYSSMDEVRKAFAGRGISDDAEMEFKLVCRAALNVSDEQCLEMCSVEGFIGDLWRVGFAIIETNTRTVTVVNQTE